MSISVTDLFSAETRDAIFNSIIANLNALKLSTTAWVSGGMARTLLLGIAQKISDVTTQLVVINKNGFRETASGNGLIVLSRNMYGVDAIVATAGSTTLTLTNSKAVSYGPFSPGQLKFAHAVTQKTYSNTATVTVAPSATTSVAVIADELGTGSNANASTITVIVSPSMSGVTCTNTSALLGRDAEADDALRQRDLDKLGAVSPNGSSGAYAYYAKTALKPDGTYVDVNRVKSVGSGGAVTVTVASTSGAVPGSTGSPGTDLYLVNQNIQTNAVPVGITATVQSATAQTVAITYTAWVSSKANKSSAEIQTAVATQLGKFLGKLDIGGVILAGTQGYVFVDALKEQIFRAVADASGVSYVRDVDISLPAADVALPAGYVATLGTLTATINLVTEA